MTPDQATAKVKEILDSFWKMFTRHEFDQRTPWPDQWASTPEAQTLIDSLAGVGGEDWISLEDKKPTEDDDQIIVTNGNGFCEIVYYSTEDEMYLKPYRFDKDDLAVYRNGQFTHWRPLPKPPKSIKP